jgi:hypothetical protein
MLFAYLTACARLDHPIARALLSGLHADQLITAIRRVWEIRPPDSEIREVADSALVQFKAINEIRNSVAHYVSFVASDRGRVISNITRALTAERIREFRISPDIMTAMIGDLEKIGQHMTFALIATVDPHAKREDMRRELSTLAASWQYKRPEDQMPSPPRRRQRRRS